MQLPFPSDAAPLGTTPSEDCLYLNIWRPDNGKKKLPVMVWIYGGGFVKGGGSPPTYSGAEMARKGVLFVSFNYRIGRFGFFAHPALAASGADNGLTGNFGYLDQIAALEWVQRNIGAFGGDPDQVTVVGESAGGLSIHALMTSPMADGLFDRAVIMSGGDGKIGLQPAGIAEAEAIGTAFAQSKGIAADDPQALAKLRALPAETIVDGLNLMALFRGTGQPRDFSGPIADGRIAIDSIAAYHSKAYWHIPIMIGATSGDMGGQDGFMIAGARDIERLLAGQGRTVYAYRFSYLPQEAEAGASPGAGAPHASDIPYFLDTQAQRLGPSMTARDDTMGATISSYLAAFVKTGNPNSRGLAHWPKYSAAEDVILDFTREGKAVAGKDPWSQDKAPVAKAP